MAVCTPYKHWLFGLFHINHKCIFQLEQQNVVWEEPSQNQQLQYD